MLARPGAPLLAESVDVDVLLGAPRLQRGDLRRGSRPAAVGLHVLEDPGAALGEVLDDLPRHPLDVRGALFDRAPGEPEALGHLPPQLRLIQKAGRLGMPVEMASIQRPPPTIRALRQIAGHDVGVQQRIAITRRPMPKRRRHQPRAAHLDHPAGTTPPPARLALHGAQRRVDGRVVRLGELPGDRRVGDPPEDAHRLRGSERQIKARHRTLTRRAAKPGPRQELLKLADLDAARSPTPAAALPTQRPGASPSPA